MFYLILFFAVAYLYTFVFCGYLEKNRITKHVTKNWGYVVSIEKGKYSLISGNSFMNEIKKIDTGKQRYGLAINKIYRVRYEKSNYEIGTLYHVIYVRNFTGLLSRAWLEVPQPSVKNI